MGSNGRERGQVGKKTYEDVQKLVKAGTKKTDAFAQVAADTDRSPGTVATAYYRVARVTPDSGVKTRPRKKPRVNASGNGRRTRATVTTKSLVSDLERALTALSKHVEQIETDLMRAKADAASYREIQKLVK